MLVTAQRFLDAPELRDLNLERVNPTPATTSG